LASDPASDESDHIKFATVSWGRSNILIEAPRPQGGISRHCIISFTFSDPGFFSEKGDISMPPSCGLLIGIYLFYENWSTETFTRRESKKELFATPAYF
jgi:hypothetical protein